MISFYRRGRLADRVAGAAVFAAGIATDYASLGLTSPQQVSFNALNTTLQAAWLTSETPETRTSITIGERDLALRAVTDMAVDLAKIIYATPTVTDPQLNALELASRPVRTPSHVIDEAPVLTIAKQQGHQFRVRVRGAAAGSRGKLPAAVGAVLYSYVGNSAPAGADGWTSEGPITKDSGIVEFGSSLAIGTKVWFTAQWFNTKGVGPACTPVAAVIGAEGAMAV
jgi:hypothetical protein